MEQEELDQKLKEAMEIFYSQVHPVIVNAVNKWVEDGHTSIYDVLALKYVRKLDDLALLTGWALDKLDGRNTSIYKEYRGSQTKKIRKALGYTL